MLSLNQRVLLATSVILSSFLGLAGVTLDGIYRQNAERALEERLFGHIDTLISSVELDTSGQLVMLKKIPSARFIRPDSDLFAQIESNDRHWRWRSESMAGMDIPFDHALARSQKSSKKITRSDGRQFYLLSYGEGGGDSPDSNGGFTFSVAQDLLVFNAGVTDFRHSLWGVLGGLALMLLAVQGTILRWGLLPLKQAKDELHAIKIGAQSHLQARYPAELQGLTDSINSLLSRQQEHLERHRRTLGDLAHSLKTPLAVLQSTVENRDADLPVVVREQVERMNQITSYQLLRASASGWMASGAPVQVNVSVDQVMGGLGKVYADKGVKTSRDIPDSLEFYGDEGDLLEILGNLLDNAFKWCKTQVCVVAESRPGAQPGQWGLFIRVEDDGMGVPPDMTRDVMQRGRRADSDVVGHGLGLSIVQDIVQVYGGTLEIGTSDWGGARLNVWIPARSVVTLAASGSSPANR